MSVGSHLAPLIREPLLHFVLAGFALFLAGRIYEQHVSMYDIVITRQHVSQLANQYALKFGSQPDNETLSELVRQDIHDEILYRKGISLHLGQDDEIVRRRIVQKMQFLMQDLAAPPEPTEQQLETFFKAHMSRYITPPLVTFSHIYFSTDQDGDAAARRRALAVLQNLSNNVNRAPARGDPFPDLYDFSAYGPTQVERLFGKTPFSKAVFSVPIGQWAGPYRSGYGWHLIYVDAREEQRQPALADVRDKVRGDYLQEAMDRANRTAFDDLAKRFAVIRRDQVTP